MEMMGMENTTPSTAEDDCPDKEGGKLVTTATFMARNSNGGVEIGRLPKHLSLAPVLRMEVSKIT